MRTNGKLSQIAERKRVRQCFRLFTAIDIFDDLVPKHAPTVVPVWIFLIEPLAFRPRDARIRLPEERGAEPHSQVQGMMPVIETIQELAPIPGLFQAVVW